MCSRNSSPTKYLYIVLSLLLLHSPTFHSSFLTASVPSRGCVMSKSFPALLGSREQPQALQRWKNETDHFVVNAPKLCQEKQKTWQVLILIKRSEVKGENKKRRKEGEVGSPPHGPSDISVCELKIFQIKPFLLQPLQPRADSCTPPGCRTAAPFL